MERVKSMGPSAPAHQALQDLRDQIKDLGHPEDCERVLSPFVHLVDRGDCPKYNDIKE
jgi:hypothetical protein